MPFSESVASGGITAVSPQQRIDHKFVALKTGVDRQGKGGSGAYFAKCDEILPRVLFFYTTPAWRRCCPQKSRAWGLEGVEIRRRETCPSRLEFSAE